jgi:hypothetical protein
MTIAELLLELESAAPDAIVVFDFCSCVPTTIASWRGDYSFPALGWSPTGYSGHGKPPTVKNLIEELEDATSGKTFGGWKGGEYAYSPNHELMIDNRGDCTATHLLCVRDEGYRVVLHARSAR